MQHGPQDGGAQPAVDPHAATTQQLPPLQGEAAEPGRAVGGRYELRRRLGSGGMCDVWEAHDPVLERAVAVKRLLPRWRDEARVRDRFAAEALRVAKLSHPAIVGVLDAGTDADGPFLVMELIDGPSLAERLDAAAADGSAGRLPVAEAVGIGIAVAQALGAAHRAGLVHRDVKPANILLDPRHGARLTDFGVAKAVAEADVTSTGEIIGTASYLSPEQALAQPIDARSDVYSLGCVLFECISGQRPFAGDSPVTTASARIGVHVRLRDRVPGVPAELEQVIARAMAPDPADRFADGDQLAAALVATGGQRSRIAVPTDGSGAGWDASPRVPTATLPTAGAAGLVSAGGAAAPADGGAWSPAGGAPDGWGGAADGGAVAGGWDPAAATVPVGRVDAPAGPGATSGSGGAGTAGGPAPAVVGGSAAAGTARRRERRTAVVVGAVAAVLLVVAAAAALRALDDDQQATDVAGAEDAATPAEAPAVGATAVPGIVASAFDPFGGDGENDDEVGALTDGDPATTWTTVGYNSAQFGNLKPGVGVVLDLGTELAVTEVRLHGMVSGQSIELRTAPAAPVDFEATEVLARGEALGADAVLAPEQPATARYLVLWLVPDLPPDGGRFRGSIGEVEVIAG